MLGWRFRLGLAVAALMLLQGCASLKGPDPSDPLEPLNRQVTAFNDVADDLVLRPVAVIYGQYLPTVVRKGIGNFFSNQSDVLSFFNSLAQLKLEAAAKNAMRVGINSTLGLGFSMPSCIWLTIFMTSASEIGAGRFFAPPTKPVTLLVCFTRCQVSSAISISTST